MNAVSESSRLPASRAVGLILRGVLLEILRRKEFYVLLLLMGLFALGVIVVSVVGIENPATATFLLNLGLSFGAVAAHLLVLITAARQIPNELETRSLYPLLAKPLSRSHYVLGKWAAATAAGIVALIFLFIMAWAPVPKLQSFDVLLLIQAVALQVVSLALLSALAILSSLILPRGVVIVGLALLYLGGERFAALLRAQAGGNRAVDWMTGYIPNFGNLSLLTRYTDGIGPLGGGEFVGLVIYGALLTVLALSLAVVLFQRRTL